jgi:hypothetical protein
MGQKSLGKGQQFQLIQRFLKGFPQGNSVGAVPRAEGFGDQQSVVRKYLVENILWPITVPDFKSLAVSSRIDFISCFGIYSLPISFVSNKTSLSS